MSQKIRIKLKSYDHNLVDKSALCRIPGMGMKSVEQLYKKLKERNILEDKETCILFRYLFV